MAQLNLVSDPVKSGAKIDMGTVTAPLDEETRKLLQQMADAYRDHLQRRVRGTPSGHDGSGSSGRPGWAGCHGVAGSGCFTSSIV